MITAKLHLKTDIKNGIKEILDSNHNVVDELVIDSLCPLSWTLSEVEQSLSTMSEEEKHYYNENTLILLKGGMAEADIKYTVYQVSINNFQYSVFLLSYDIYTSLFLKNLVQ